MGGVIPEPAPRPRTAATATTERPGRAELRAQIEQLQRHHPDACSGCLLEQTQKELQQLDAARDAAIETLIAGGTPTDQAIRLVDVLAEHGYTYPELPASGHGATAEVVLHDLTPAERIALGNLIAGGPDVLWPRWLEAALERVETDDRIEVEYEVLRSRLDEAVTAIRDVRAAYGFLTSLGGEDAGDDLLDRYIDEADRAIRTAQRINPHR